jgi:bifunctional N-acetylglucosamine-1-phosphate-uridyltransferase/glucosamine-1-phosphate-acetyltransferase GlmU-like protein
LAAVALVDNQQAVLQIPLALTDQIQFFLPSLQQAVGEAVRPMVLLLTKTQHQAVLVAALEMPLLVMATRQALHQAKEIMAAKEVQALRGMGRAAVAEREP